MKIELHDELMIKMFELFAEIFNETFPHLSAFIAKQDDDLEYHDRFEPHDILLQISDKLTSKKICIIALNQFTCYWIESPEKFIGMEGIKQICSFLEIYPSTLKWDFSIYYNK